MTNPSLFGSGLTLDALNINAGTLASGGALLFGAGATGEGIASRRTYDATGTLNQNGLDFYTNSTRRLSITNTGRVGIGNTNPAQALDVTGNVRATGNVVASNFTYSTPKTGYLGIPGSEFRPCFSTYDYRSSTGNGGSYTTDGGVAYLLAPVHLPEGATITNLDVWFEDTDATYDMSCYLSKEYFAGGFSSAYASLMSSGSAGRQQKTATLSHVVSTNTGGYILWTQTTNATSSHKICGARLTYTIPAP